MMHWEQDFTQGDPSVEWDAKDMSSKLKIDPEVRRLSHACFQKLQKERYVPNEEKKEKFFSFYHQMAEVARQYYGTVTLDFDEKDGSAVLALKGEVFSDLMDEQARQLFATLILEYDWFELSSEDDQVCFIVYASLYDRV